MSDTVQNRHLQRPTSHRQRLPVPGTASVTFNGGGGDKVRHHHYNGNPDVKAAPGFAMTPYATGFLPLNTNFGGLNDGCRAASGLAFDSSGNLFVSDMHSGNVYKFLPGGGIVGATTLLTPAALGPGLESLTFGNDGKLYGAQNATTGNFFTGAVIEINPASGALVRTVASSITCASFVATDPLSGDLFVNDSCAGGGSENGSVWRIANPSGPTPTTSVYAASPGVNGGISIAPGGTIYMISYHENGNAGGVVRIAGTSAPTPGAITTVAGITGPALGINASGAQPNGDATSLTLAAAPRRRQPCTRHPRVRHHHRHGTCQRAGRAERFRQRAGHRPRRLPVRELRRRGIQNHQCRRIVSAHVRRCDVDGDTRTVAPSPCAGQFADVHRDAASRNARSGHVGILPRRRREQRPVSRGDRCERQRDVLAHRRERRHRHDPGEHIVRG